MKWYFASRVRHQEALKQVATFLQSQGQEFSSDWVFASSLKPYEDHIREAGELAAQVVSAIGESDVFVLISDPEGTDMFAELGIALAKNVKTYIVGEYGKRSVMQLHPSIVHAGKLKDIFEREGIETKDLEDLNLDF